MAGLSVYTANGGAKASSEATSAMTQDAGLPPRLSPQAKPQPTGGTKLSVTGQYEVPLLLFLAFSLFLAEIMASGVLQQALRGQQLIKAPQPDLKSRSNRTAFVFSQ